MDFKKISAYKLSDGTIVEGRELAEQKQAEINKRFVNVEITAKVTTTIELREGETINDVKNRLVDIYLHNNWDNHNNPNIYNGEKVDLGASEYSIEVLY